MVRSRLFVLLAPILLAACGGGGTAERGTATAGFAVQSISVAPGEVWRINRPIDVVFNDEVDPATVNLNTIGVRSLLGEPATGSFHLREGGRVVRFEPSCPAREDLADAGLRPGTAYRIVLPGDSGGGPTVLSSAGETLAIGRSVTFHTPDSADPAVLFLDPVPGPPALRVRGRDGVATDESEATHLEVLSEEEDGSLVPRRVYFRWDEVQQVGLLEPGPWLPTDPASGEPRVPLNLYSLPSSRVAVRLFLDQPIDPAPNNVAGGALGFEYEAAPGDWRAFGSEVLLEENCTATGATVRLVPRGILPQGAGLRVRVGAGLADLTGDPTLLDAVQFARMQVAVARNPVAGSADDGRSADEVLESFLVGGAGEGSLEDTTAVFAEPAAEWGDGRLRASFEFGGSGGPGGDFSWRVPAGTTRILDSTVDVITGGPGGVPTTSLTVVGGVIDVLDLTIEEGATLLVQGPNPLTILAAGEVRILGTLSVSGTSSTSVGTLNTTNQPEPGGPGQAGGGSGGTASFLVTQSTPRGGPGRGAFEQAGGGGQGGETSYHPDVRDSRRGGGGGGGRLGPDVVHPFDPAGTPDPDEDPLVLCQTVIGLDAEPGFAGGFGGLGAESQTERGRGGVVADPPFVDEDPFNDFHGRMIRRYTELVDGEPVLREELVLGELLEVHAGSGGGAGGDAVLSGSFPLVPFLDTGDEKGAGGGGGAGGLRILCTGDVVIGPQGRIRADGGAGAAGENVGFFDRIGGGGGGGSGGHVVISTAGALRFEGPGADAAGAWYNDEDTGNRTRSITALGGQGGAGWDNVGGANELGGTTWFCDAIPFDAFSDVESGQLVASPPLDRNCFRNLEGVDTNPMDLFDWDDPDFVGNPGGGGDGSPGIVQVHVNDPSSDIVFPDGGVYGQGADVTRWFAPPPHGWNGPSGRVVEGQTTSVTVPPDYMVPFFGRLSRSRSRWVPLGLARVNPGDVAPTFAFDGTSAGLVDALDGRVDLGPPLLGPLPLGDGTPPLVVDEDRRGLLLDASGLDGEDELYRRNPRLVRGLAVRLEPDGAPDDGELFEVVDADYDPLLDRLRLRVGGDGPLELDGVADEDLLVSLLRRDLRISTSGAIDLLPASTSIRIEFQATVADGEGRPSESDASPLVAELSDLDPDGPAGGLDWDFLRFQVTFDLNAQGDPDLDLADAPRPALDFLRLRLRF